MPFFKTAFNGYSVKFSPFVENRLAVATAQNFGIIGNGRQYILDITPAGIQEFVSYSTADGVFDCTWSEGNANVLISASGDGSIKVWDTAIPPMQNPVRSLEEHSHEVYSVDWNTMKRDSFLSASWDDTVKLWTLDVPGSLRTFREHEYCVYNAIWNPAHADVFASCSGDRSMKIWDIREPRSTMTIPVSPDEVLSCDWNKYNDCLLASGSVDRVIRIWDVRQPLQPITALEGHTYGVRRVKFSPHNPSILCSCAYDMTVCIWNFMAPENALISRLDHHTEFALGLDLSLLTEGLMASCAWDEKVFVWKEGTDPRMF